MKKTFSLLVFLFTIAQLKSQVTIGPYYNIESFNADFSEKRALPFEKNNSYVIQIITEQDNNSVGIHLCGFEDKTSHRTLDSKIIFDIEKSNVIYHEEEKNSFITINDGTNIFSAYLNEMRLSDKSKNIGYKIYNTTIPTLSTSELSQIIEDITMMKYPNIVNIKFDKAYAKLQDSIRSDNITTWGLLPLLIDCRKYATQQKGEIKVNNCKKIGDHFSSILKFTNDDELKAYCLFNKALIEMSFDSDNKEGKAAPLLQGVVTLIEPMKTPSRNTIFMLKYAYKYLINDSFARRRSNRAEAKEWASKLLKLFPSDDLARQILELK